MLRSRVLEVRRDAPFTTRLVDDPLDAPAAGELLLAVERFALTANNVTYALLGDRLGQWRPFPAREPGWGRVPAWGVARVVEGVVGDARPGRRLAGFLPMATHLTVAAAPTPRGVCATGPTRVEQDAIYRDLDVLPDRPSGAPGWTGTDDDLAVVLRPSVRTAAHLADAVRRSAAPGQVVLSSATSRTAMLTAVLLRRAGTRVVGLTAPEHVAVASGAAAFDVVLGYDAIERLERVPGTVHVDVAGRADTAAALHRHLDAALVHHLVVGAAHAPATGVPGGAAPVGARSPLAVEHFAVGPRRTAVIARGGRAHVDALEHDAAGPLAAWATHHLAVRRIDGLEAAREAWSRLGRGELVPLTTSVVAPL